MAMQALQTTLDDETADQAWSTDGGGYEANVPREVWMLVRNLQHQINALEGRIEELEP